MDKIGVALVGLGYWGPNLLRNLVQNRDFVVKAVVELDPKRRELAASLAPQAEITDSYFSVLEDDSIQAIVIATPAKTHFSLAKEALLHGKHLLVEKPLSNTRAEVTELTELSERSGKVLMSGHTFIFNSAVRYLKEYIRNGSLGELRYIYSQRLNLGRIRSDIDSLWNFAPHDISIIQYLLDDAEHVEIQRSGMDFVQEGIDDVVFLTLKYSNKVLANIHVSWLDPQRKRKMVLVGSEKMIVYDDIAENKIVIYDKGIDRHAALGENMDYDQSTGPLFQYRAGDVVAPKIDWQEPLKTEIQHFSDCIQGKTECLTGPKHSLRVISVLEEASLLREQRGALKDSLVVERFGGVETESQGGLEQGDREESFVGS